MKKIIVGILTFIILIGFIAPVKAEEVTEAPTDDPTTEVTETTEETTEDRLSEIESQLQAIQDGITADEIDNSTPVKWLEKYLGISLAGIGSFLLGIFATLLIFIKYLKKAKSIIGTSDSLSKKTQALCKETNGMIDTVQVQMAEIVAENKLVSEETKTKLLAMSATIDNFQKYIDNNNKSVVLLLDQLDGALDDKEEI